MPRLSSIENFVFRSSLSAVDEDPEQSNYLGATMLFVQTSAPTGWTKVTTYNDRGLRCVSGSVSTGGVNTFSSTLTSKTLNGSLSLSGSAGSTTLTTPTIAAHVHPVANPGNNPDQERLMTRTPNPPGTAPYVEFSPTAPITTGSLSSSTYFPGGITGHPGTTTGHVHAVTNPSPFNYATYNFAVKYVDVILAIRN
jgi:hypothetical protein